MREWSVRYGAVIVIFLLSGLSLKTRVLAAALKRLPLHLFIQGISLGLTPLVGWGVGAGLALSPAMSAPLASGVVICACMPTTVSTNVVFTHDAGGNEAVALINAVVGNIIGVFISPGLLQLYLGGSSGGGPSAYTGVIQSLTVCVVAPLLIGQAVLAMAEGAVAKVQRYVNFGKVSNVCVLLLIWSTFCNTFYQQVSSSASSIVITVAIQVLLFSTFTAMCLLASRAPPVRRLLALDRADAVAVAMCGATKTIALGMPVITVMYGHQPDAGLLALPLLIYHSSQILLGSALVRPLKAWVEREEGDGGEVQRPVEGSAAALRAAAGGSEGSGGVCEVTLRSMQDCEDDEGSKSKGREMGWHGAGAGLEANEAGAGLKANEESAVEAGVESERNGERLGSLGAGMAGPTVGVVGSVGMGQLAGGRTAWGVSEEQGGCDGALRAEGAQGGVGVG